LGRELLLNKSQFIGLLALNKKNKLYSSTVPIKKRLTKVERSKIKIKSPLDEIMIGLLLGDGHIQSRN
jgi:hypothetical protein